MISMGASGKGGGGKNSHETPCEKSPPNNPLANPSIFLKSLGTKENNKINSVVWSERPIVLINLIL